MPKKNLSKPKPKTPQNPQPGKSPVIVLNELRREAHELMEKSAILSTTAHTIYDKLGRFTVSDDGNLTGWNDTVKY
jgi:hypothetical protein